MKPPILIDIHTAHFWRVLLTDFFPQENDYAHLLNSEELARANRFRFPQHRQRFVIARGMLRQILSQYTGILPQDIHFSYGEKGKPYLQDTIFNLQFNVSHSGDVAVYALTTEAEIGIDIQKIEEKFEEGIAERYFSKEEYAELQTLNESERLLGFYQLWAYKEALIKAAGAGIYIPLGDFSVKLQESSQWVFLAYDNQRYYLEKMTINPDYCSAFATPQQVEKKLYWEWTSNGPTSLSSLSLSCF